MVNKRLFTIAFVAGEASGDILGAGLIHKLKNRIHNVKFIGVAGPLMRAAGCETWYQMEELAVMGIVEVISDLYRLLHIRKDLIRRFTILKPDVFVGIDAPDFNLLLEKNLKDQGIITIHYVSPSIWAWRKRRILKIGKSTNLVLLTFPFEKIFYERFNIPHRFIGHTIADSIPLYPNKKKSRDILGIHQHACCLALLPGSRKTEVEILSADFLRTAQILYTMYPNLEIIIPMVNIELLKQFEEIKNHVVPTLPIHLLYGKSIDVMVASDIALIASGTASLECMLAKCPMVVGYRMRKFTFWLAKKLVKTNYISLPNLLAGREIVKEFLQEKCHPHLLAKELVSLLENKQNVQKMREIFSILHQEIRCNADEQAANAVLELIQ